MANITRFNPFTDLARIDPFANAALCCWMPCGCRESLCAGIRSRGHGGLSNPGVAAGRGGA